MKTTTGNARILAAQRENERAVLAHIRECNRSGELPSSCGWPLVWMNAEDRLRARGRTRFARSGIFGGIVARGFGLRAGRVVRIAKAGR